MLQDWRQNAADVAGEIFKLLLNSQLLLKKIFLPEHEDVTPLQFWNYRSSSSMADLVSQPEWLSEATYAESNEESKESKSQ